MVNNPTKWTTFKICPVLKHPLSASKWQSPATAMVWEQDQTLHVDFLKFRQQRPQGLRLDSSQVTPRIPRGAEARTEATCDLQPTPCLRALNGLNGHKWTMTHYDQLGIDYPTTAVSSIVWFYFNHRSCWECHASCNSLQCFQPGLCTTPTLASAPWLQLRSQDERLNFWLSSVDQVLSDQLSRRSVHGTWGFTFHQDIFASKAPFADWTCHSKQQEMVLKFDRFVFLSPTNIFRSLPVSEINSFSSDWPHNTPKAYNEPTASSTTCSSSLHEEAGALGECHRCHFMYSHLCHLPFCGTSQNQTCQLRRRHRDFSKACEVKL